MVQAIPQWLLPGVWLYWFTNVTWLTFQAEKVKCYPFVCQISSWASTFYKRKWGAVIAPGILHSCQGSCSLSCPKTSSNTAPYNAVDSEWKPAWNVQHTSSMPSWKPEKGEATQTNKHHPSLGKKNPTRLPTLDLCSVWQELHFQGHCTSHWASQPPKSVIDNEAVCLSSQGWTGMTFLLQCSKRLALA